MPVEFKDYYKTLGVSKNAGRDEIRKAFRKLARRYHPDVAKDKANAEQKFKEINEAYEVLSDPEKRRKYDTLGSDWQNADRFQQQYSHGPEPGFDTGRGRDFEFHFGGTGFSEFFERFFGGTGTGFDGFSPFEEPESFSQFSRKTGTGHRGNNIEADVLVTLQEAINGSVRVLTLRHTDPATGRTGTESVHVRIPAGVRDGQKVRVPGKGGRGAGGAPAGDLFLKVKIAKHPDFTIHGDDIFHELELAPWEAVLGCTASVPTLNGSVSLKIPPHTKSGSRLRIRGKGMPTRTGQRGDLYAVVTIQTPDKTSEEERRLWEELATKSGFNPRKA
ncbi:MAG: DnaJ domain-containing protein [Verrucomicrobia bacterium]|nr:DnaJ domain-containing protein [Verrucomicrobiota bacterium]MCF7708675.1 DnaJ domain-containing protein [Verrucomicrobiota bacterium]